jgi:hypothetical protein
MPTAPQTYSAVLISGGNRGRALCFQYAAKLVAAVSYRLWLVTENEFDHQLRRIFSKLMKVQQENYCGLALRNCVPFDLGGHYNYADRRQRIQDAPSDGV